AQRTHAAPPSRPRGQGPVLLPLRPLGGAARRGPLSPRPAPEGGGAGCGAGGGPGHGGQAGVHGPLLRAAGGKLQGRGRRFRTGRDRGRGLGLASPQALYVLKIEPGSRRIVVGEEEALLSDSCTLERTRWIPFERPG